MIEFANALDRLLQLLIIGEQAANLGDPLASHAELPCASTAIADCQNEDPVSFTARTFWAVLGVAGGGVQQRTPAPVTGSLLRSFSRARRARAQIIHTNESTAAATVNFKSVRACSFPQKLR